jgi:hypothetical protein
MENENKACECEDCTLPRFWKMELGVSEKLVLKINPTFFLQHLDPFMQELGRKIIEAKIIGKGFILEASIRFPEYIALGEEKKENAAPKE